MPTKPASRKAPPRKPKARKEASKKPVSKKPVSKKPVSKKRVSKKPANRKPAREARDIERAYPAKRFVSKLRRLADAIEANRAFRIQVGGERVAVPADAMISVEHERSGGVEEIELQFRWTNA